ncbi:MAG: hypothetical protein AAB480_03635 [Patescibacteria group bacterium]
MNSKIVYVSALAFAVVLSMSVVPTLAFAQAEDGGCCDTGWFDSGSGYTPDTGWYDSGSGYTPETGWYDSGSGYTPETGWYDSGSGYTPETGWYDSGSGYSPETGWYDSGSGYVPEYSEYTYDTTDYTYQDTYYRESYQQSYPQSYKPAPTFYAPGYSAPQQRTNTVYAQQQQQQQQQQQGGGGPINIVNNNNNVNTNTNVASVSQATPQHIVQYVSQPSYPTYYPVYQPTYNYPVYNTQLPYCTITATTGYNGLVTLYWSSSYATSAYISPSVGSVSPNGSTSLYNYGNGVYTMTVSGQGGSNTCRTSYVQPVVQTPTVSLTQIPYTGFDFGPVGNAMYWLSMFAFAAAGAYLLVYFLPRLWAVKAGRGLLARNAQASGAFALVGSTLGSFRRKPEAVAVKTAPAAMAPAVAPVAPKANVFEHLPTMQTSETNDSMSISRTANGAPRIVVTRS